MIWQIIPTFGEFVLAIVMWFACFFIGFLLTENVHTAIWMKVEAFDMRPFNCRKCLTTHITWICFTMLAYLSGWRYLYLGAMAAAWTYYILAHRDYE